MNEYDSLRYLAVAIANCLVEGKSLEEIKRLCLFVNLLHHNIQSEITCRAFMLFPKGVNSDNNITGLGDNPKRNE